MGNDNVKSMIFYQSWLDATELMTDGDKLEYYEAIFAYGFSGEMPDIDSPMVKMAMQFVSSAIDRNKEKRERIIEKRREAGKKHKGNQYTNNLEQNRTNGTSVPTMEQNGTNGTINDNVNVNDNVNDNVDNIMLSINKKEKLSKESKKEKTLTRFSAPSLEEVFSYSEEIGLPKVSAEEFHDHFTSNGWKVSGKAPMKDWKAALRQWKRRENEFGKTEQPGKRTTVAVEYVNDKPTESAHGGFLQYKNELAQAKGGSEEMRIKHPNWENLCKRYSI